jgi:hypothetical protein
VLEASSDVLEVLTALDAQTALGEVIAQTAEALDLGLEDTTRLRREGARLTRELLELGALDLRI